MLFNSHDAPLLVVVSLLCIYQPESVDIAEETVAKINENLPQCCLNESHVRGICTYLYDHMCEWTSFVIGLNPEEDRCIVLSEFLNNGSLAAYTLPPDEITTDGLQRTLDRIFAYAREHAMNHGVLELQTSTSMEDLD